MAAKTRLVIGFKDDIGVERDNMEDAAGYSMASTNMDVRRKGSVFVVADGVGGHESGEVASNRAVNTILKEYYACPYDDTETSLRHAINQANEVIFKQAQDSGRETMATTAVCAVVRDGLLTLANVGDSRVYLLRDGKIRQLTEDHSWVNEQIRAGLLSEEQALDNPYRNVITRSLGNKPKVEADISTPGSLLDNDLLILCSDGMYEGVAEEDMLEVTRRLSSVQAAEELVNLAKQGGSTDNITVMIVEAHISGEPEGIPVPMEMQPPASREPKTHPRSLQDEPRQISEVPAANKTTGGQSLPAHPAEDPAMPVDPNNIFHQPGEMPDVLSSSDDKPQPFVVQPFVDGPAAQPLNPAPSQASTVMRFKVPPPSEGQAEPGEVEILPRRRLYWEWEIEYRSPGDRSAVEIKKTIKLPDSTQIILAFKVIPSYFKNTLTNATYDHPLAFELSAQFPPGEKDHRKSKVIVGAGFYNSVKDRMTLADLAKKKFEILVSNDEIFLINKANPLIFATIDLVEFENPQNHGVEQEKLTILQLKVRFHVIQS